MKCFLLCLSLHFLINSQHVLNDFTQVLPFEIATIIFEHIACRSLNDFYQFLIVQSVSKEVSSIIQSTEQKKWHGCIQYLFDNNRYELLKRISVKSVYLPDCYKNTFISLFLEHSVQNSKQYKPYIQKMNPSKQPSSKDFLFTKNLIDTMIFFDSLPSELERRLEPFIKNNTIIFYENCNNEYMNELLFLNNDINGLKMCIEKSHVDVFEKAYDYAMKSAVPCDKKYLQSNKIKLSKKLLIFAANRGHQHFAEYIYLYLKSLLLIDDSLFDISMFFYTITSKILSSSNQGDSIVKFIFQDLYESFKQQEV